MIDHISSPHTMEIQRSKYVKIDERISNTQQTYTPKSKGRFGNNGYPF